MKRPITKIDMRNIDPDWLRHAHEERLARQGGRSTPDNGTAARGADGGRGEDRGRPVADGPRKKGAKKVQFPRTKSVENVINFRHFLGMCQRRDKSVAFVKLRVTNVTRWFQSVSLWGQYVSPFGVICCSSFTGTFIARWRDNHRSHYCIAPPMDHTWGVSLGERSW